MDASVFGDDLIRQRFGRVQVGLVDGGLAEINGGAVHAEVKTDGLRPAGHDEGLGQDVLPRVLLHVVVAPRPGNLTIHRAGGQARVQQMPHGVIVRADVGHSNAVEQASVMGLSAAGGIKRAGGERHGRLAVDRGQVAHGGLEAAQVGIMPIKAC